MSPQLICHVTAGGMDSGAPSQPARLPPPWEDYLQETDFYWGGAQGGDIGHFRSHLGGE